MDMDVFTDKEEDPKIFLDMKFSVDGIFHLWMGIANYQSYRVNDPDPEIEPMMSNHPLIRIQHTIHGMLDGLIAEGMRGGFYIAPLIEIKRILAQPATENGDG
jgi:hypothetical protein